MEFKTNNWLISSSIVDCVAKVNSDRFISDEKIANNMGNNRFDIHIEYGSQVISIDLLVRLFFLVFQCNTESSERIAGHHQQQTTIVILISEKFWL